MVMNEFDKVFQKRFRKLDSDWKLKIKKQIVRIIENPEIGKPMRYERKDTREVYIAPYRLSYAFLKRENKIIFLEIYHKDKQ